MSRSEALDISQDLHMTLELVSEDQEELDLAVTNAIGRDVVVALQDDGYLVRLADRPTKTRGGELLVELIKAMSSFAANISANRDLYEHILNDSSALVTICAGVVPALRFLKQKYEKHARRGSGPIKLTVEIDGKPVTVEAPDLEQADAALKLAHQYATQHPTTAAKVTPQSKTKAKAIVPGQQRRKKK